MILLKAEPLKRAYGKAGNGNEMETENGKGNQKLKNREMETQHFHYCSPSKI